MKGRGQCGPLDGTVLVQRFWSDRSFCGLLRRRDVAFAPPNVQHGDKEAPKTLIFFRRLDQINWKKFNESSQWIHVPVEKRSCHEGDPTVCVHGGVMSQWRNAPVMKEILQYVFTVSSNLVRTKI